MFNIQKAVSRLDYAPRLKEIQITDIKKGLGVFIPKPSKAVSYAALKTVLKKAGYTLASAHITIAGELTRDDKGSWVLVEPSGQCFDLEIKDADHLARVTPNLVVEVVGKWRTEGEGNSAQEVVITTALRQLTTPAKATSATSTEGKPLGERTDFSFVRASFSGSEGFPSMRTPSGVSKPLAPIRVTSPGLTVYKGGAVTPRLYLVDQHLGDLEVSRQVFNLSVSYTPSPRVQLEVEMPVSRTAFDDKVTSGSSVGLGNITVWSKYRFFRKVKTYGDRQAAVRFGLELPTGESDAPSQASVNAPAFVRQQLTPISGGLSPHFDLSFSQAGGRFIFGGNVEGIVRYERNGFRMGHELRVSSDFEYVLLPRKYDVPGGELFVILETTFVHRGLGRLDGVTVAGSKATEFYLAPGLQYAARTRFVVEGSVQLPVVRNTGPLILRNDRNILMGVRYLF